MGTYNKIVIVTLSKEFSNEVCKLLCDSLGMIYCDVNEFLEYEIAGQNEKNMSLKSLKQLEKKAIKNVSTFENVCISITYEQLLQNKLCFGEDSIIVYVGLPKCYIKANSAVDFLCYDERHKELEQIATLSFNVRKVNAESIKTKIENLLGRLV